MSSNRKNRRAEKSLDRKRGSPQLIQTTFAEALKHHQAGRLEDAERLYKRVLNLDPDHANSLHLLGVVASQMNLPELAVKMIGRAIELKPNDSVFHNNLGSAYKDMQKFEEAEAQYRYALTLDPRYADALSNLGDLLRSRGRPDEAMDCYRRVMMLYPDHAGVHNNLGMLFRDQGKLDEAETMFRQACRLDSTFVEGPVYVGRVLQDKHRFDEAIVQYKTVLAEKPTSVKALCGLGNASMALGKVDDGMAYYAQAVTLTRDFPAIYSNLLLAMIYAASVTPEQVAAAARDFGQRLQALPFERPAPVSDKNPERKLRIGYVSPDFRAHAVNYFFEFVLTLHDRAKFEIFAYSNTAREDAVTLRLKGKFDHWRNILILNDDEATKAIAEDKIDILVDLAGHTGLNRLPVFDRRPAPVQVTWLGYPATTGMTTIDYRITDNYAEPPGMTEHLNSEALWRLPDMFCCYQAHENSPPVIDHPPFEDNGYITFGCFNNFAKVTDPVLEIWAQIMARVPDSRLLLEITGIESPQFRADMLARFGRLGLPPDRIILEARKPANQFVLYNRIDIALDPFPANGGTTSMDTLWMGVPLITLAGRHVVSRLGVTILTNGGLPELIAESRAEYIQLATALALDRDRLRALRRNLRQKVAASPLMDQERFTRNLEAAYREMWRIWCAQPDKSHVIAQG